ncbi:MAG: SUMF1/EgtB/PvdO family nonheme iron enzyme [Candidatus Eisenbacteria sp.]|nr:SUMF1/EgtB/PvdO family nonheme iron enzyme [Candidatus Eisenbacteria bacterium]
MSKEIGGSIEAPSSWAQDAYPDGYDPADHPVKVVNWFGAARYCDWLSLQAGLPRAYEHSGDWSCNGGDTYGAEGYRLPTDAEWEYAAQYEGERIYPWGDEAPNCSRVNFDDTCVGWTSPVRSYPDAPEALALSDMAGNVWDWCDDWHVCDLGTSCKGDSDEANLGTAGRCSFREGVCPVKAGMFSGSQSHRGKSQKPRSLDHIGGGNEAGEADRQSHLRDGERVTGPQRE